MDDLIRRSDVLMLLDHLIRECVGMNKNVDNVLLDAEIATIKDVVEKVVALPVVKTEEECHLYEKRMGDRREYRYGPDWVASQLWIEGGFPTPEEAKAAWLREHK